MLLHAKFQKRMPHKPQFNNEIPKRRQLSGPRIPGFLTAHILQFCRRSRRCVVGEPALPIGASSAAPPVRRQARKPTAAKHWTTPFVWVSKLICTKRFASLQNSLYCESVLRSAKITVASY